NINLQANPRHREENAPDFRDIKRLLELDVHRLAMAAHHRYPDARRGDADRLIPEDLSRFVHHLMLFPRITVVEEDIDLRKDVIGDRMGEFPFRARLSCDLGVELADRLLSRP